ncbi:MAG: hypothetical protein BGN88_04425 [Clostridiales bacterium 43-6]|nr:MAG: hypothetical protein BGN88_04425 [Clostridiales bacterium 43-6]
MKVVSLLVANQSGTSYNNIQERVIALKKCIVMMLVFSFMLGLWWFPATAEGQRVKIAAGDVYHDGKVDVVDLVLIKRHVLKITDITAKTGLIGDLDYDGVINVMDLVIMKKHILKLVKIDDYRLTKINFPNSYHKGINLGNMLEAPYEGEWGIRFQDEYIPLIKSRGFDFVRVPIRWSVYQKNGVIDEAFFQRMDHILNVIIANKMGAIINIHHYEELFLDYKGQKDTFYGLWGQIAERYKNLPSSISFELLNEPHGTLTPEVWIPMQNKCIEIVRKTNRTRKIIVSAANWGGIEGIENLILPKDQNLILSFHYYSPFQFTHQGASWADNMDQYLGTKWTGNDIEKQEIESAFQKIRAWSQATGIPVLMGEFGAYEKAEYESRVRWTAFVRETAEKYGFSWSYWEFCAGFGIYKDPTKSFLEELTNALVPSAPNPVLGTGRGNPYAIATFTANNKGPVIYQSVVPYVNYAWTGILTYDVDDGVMINIANCVDWGRVYFPVDITDTRDGFSSNTITVTFQNIDSSITDIVFAVENKEMKKEAYIKGFNNTELFKNDVDIVQNSDGTTTIMLDLSGAYSKMKGTFGQGLYLKAYIEADPNRKAWYDRKGIMKVLGVTTK